MPHKPSASVDTTGELVRFGRTISGVASGLIPARPKLDSFCFVGHLPLRGALGTAFPDASGTGFIDTGKGGLTHVARPETSLKPLSQPYGHRPDLVVTRAGGHGVLVGVTVNLHWEQRRTP